MPGSIRKRGDSWELRAYAGTDPNTGKRKWVSATVKGSRRAAQCELVELVRRVDYPRCMTSKVTVATLLQDWYQAVSSNWSPTTAAQTKSIINHHLVPRLGKMPITTVSARLSHARTSTTLNVYTHAVPSGDVLAAEVLGSILRDARAGTNTRRRLLHRSLWGHITSFCRAQRASLIRGEGRVTFTWSG